MKAKTTKPAAKSAAGKKSTAAAEAKTKTVKIPAAPSVKAKRRVTFTYRAEPGLTVNLAGCFNNWDPTAKEMVDSKKNGIYSATLMLAPDSYEYKFVIDGTWCADPECADWVQNDHGTLNSVRHVGA
jgi:1,4-alpha-glucan branching enzyme